MGTSPSLIPIDLGALFDAPLKRLLTPVEPAIQKFLMVDRLGGMLQSACRETHGQDVFERLLTLLEVTYQVAPADLSRIPATGPVVVTANHPFGFLEAADGHEVYFHRNSVLPDAYDRLAVGTRVTFAEEMGEKGPQASTVKLLGKRGLRV